MTKDFTLEDIAKLITESEARLEAKFTKRMDEKFQESKNYTDEHFNWLASQMMQGFARLDEKIDNLDLDLRREMKVGFEKVDRKFKFIETNHGARLEILEEKVL